MADPVQSDSTVPKHGILVVHGAGSPVDQKTYVGDPLSGIANGLVDSLKDDEQFRDRYRAAVRADADVEKRTLKHLTIDLFEKPQTGGAEKRVCEIRMSEALWKPTMPKVGLTTYIPLLWLWAFTFYSQSSRKIKSLSIAPLQQETERAAARRRRGDLLARLILAVLGLLCTEMWLAIARALYPLLNLGLSAETLALIRMWIAPTVLSLSITAAILLVLLGWEEWRNRQRKDNKPLGNLHMGTIILATAWLGLFVVPVLLLLYYLDRILVLAIVVGIAALPILVIDWLGFGYASIGFLFAFTFAIWLVSRARFKDNIPARFSGALRENMQTSLANWITTLLVVCGAPLLIVFISVLELLAVLPLAGDSLKKTAQAISEAGIWEAIKDIHMYLTDSSRAACARCIIEKGIVDLNAADVTAIHLFSHSLGTVVAWDTLVHIGRDAGALVRKNDVVHKKIKTLVTYGSPLNKVRILAKKVGEALHADPPVEIMAGLDHPRFDDSACLPDDCKEFRWYNFFAPQDIVSDMLTQYHRATDPDSRAQDPTIPHEYWTPSATDIFTAHGAYWTDRDFWRTTLKAMGIVA